VKVAQFEVLGNEAKGKSVPQGTIETLGFWSRTWFSDYQHSSIVPSGTNSSLKTLTQHFVLGYFRQVPAGLIFSNHQTCATLIARPQVDADGRLPDRCLKQRRGTLATLNTS